MDDGKRELEAGELAKRSKKNKIEGTNHKWE